MKYFFGLLVLCLILFVEINLIMNLIEQRYQIGPKYNNIIKIESIDNSTIIGYYNGKKVKLKIIE